MKKILPLILLALISLLISCWADNQDETIINDTKNNTIDNTSEQNDSSTEVSNEECLNGCYNMWKSNPWNKDKTEDEMHKNCNDLCNATQWIQNNDLSSCEKSNDPLLKNSCYSEVAKTNWDVTICDSISDELLKDTCIIWVAEKLKDISLCDKISSTIMKPSCEDWVNNQ